ncbi:MAG: hypothetical protein ACKV22_18500 [Bryobacteraceae bacterium]
MNTICIGCGENLAASQQPEPVCDDDRCREIVTLERQLDVLKIANLQQRISLAALRAIFRDLQNPNTRIPGDIESQAVPVCDSIDERIEFAEPGRAYYFYLAIARHVDARMLAAREELEAA